MLDVIIGVVISVIGMGVLYMLWEWFWSILPDLLLKLAGCLILYGIHLKAAALGSIGQVVVDLCIIAFVLWATFFAYAGPDDESLRTPSPDELKYGCYFPGGVKK